MLTAMLLALVATAVVAGFFLVAKRRQPKAQALYSEHSVPTADEISKALAERLALDAALFPQLQPSAAELAERRAFDAVVRQELEQCTDADLEAIEAPRFMFLRYSDDQGFRVRVTLRQRVAHELLDERVNAAGAIERLDFPADGRAFGGPRTCGTHVGEVSFAAQDDDGRLSKLSNWFFDRLRKTCL